MSISSIINSVGKYVWKGAGLAALGVIAYDAHVVGKLQSDVYAKTKDANACIETFSNTQYLSSPSITTAKLKNVVNDIETEGNLRHFVNSGIGYFKGFFSMLINDVVPLGLGLGALFGKKFISKCCGIGLAAYAGIKLFKDVLGFGHYNDLNRKY